MKSLVTSLLLLLLATSNAAGPSWENKIIGNVSIEVPTDCQANIQNTPGSGPVESMKKYSFRNRVLDLELVFLSFPPGTGGNLEGAAANMTAQLRAVSGEESLTPWKTTTVSRRPARRIATKPDPTHEARLATLIDNTKAKNQLVIVDISYDSTSSSGKADAERITKSVSVK